MSFIPPKPETYVGDIRALLAGNRLEPRPRTREFNRSLRAEIRDPTWMLTRQWQLKEFRAEDGGTPAAVALSVETAMLHQMRAAGAGAPVQALDTQQPLDALLQAQQVPVDAGVRLRLGRYWVQLLRQAGLGSFVGAYATAARLEPPVALPAHGVAAALLETQADANDFLRAAAGKIPDGFALYQLSAGNAADLLAMATGATIAQRDTLTMLVSRFRDWVERMYLSGGPSWDVDGLAYQFAVAAPAAGLTPAVFAGVDHAGDQLAWYGTDRAPATTTDGFTNSRRPSLRTTQTSTVLPTQVQFAGSPNPRWWAFEDGKTDLGQLQGDSSDFGRMLLQEFVFLYQSNWFTIPCTLPTGSVATVTSLVVTDVFGQRFRLDPAGRSSQVEPGSSTSLENDWGRWSLFAQAVHGQREQSDPALLLLPVSQTPLTGPAVEQVAFLRDEAANLVWGVEQTVPDGLGRGLNGADAAQRVRETLRGQALADLNQAPVAAEQFRLARPVPENWIPFLPRPASADPTHGMVLEQGVVPRVVEGLSFPVEEEAYVQPRTPLLQYVPADEPYLLQERRVPASGVRVAGRFRRARWYDGRTVVWYGYERGVGQPGGGSGLAFDQLTPQPPAPADADLLPATVAYRQRVEADGGTVLFIRRVDAAYRYLAGLTPAARGIWVSPSFGTKRAADGTLVRVYCLFGNDLVPDGAGSVSWAEEGVNGRPAFATSGGALRTEAALALASTQVTAAVVFRSEQAAAGVLFSYGEDIRTQPGFQAGIEGTGLYALRAHYTDDALAALDGVQPNRVDALIGSWNRARTTREVRLLVNGIRSDYSHLVDGQDADADNPAEVLPPQLVWLGSPDRVPVTGTTYLGDFCLLDQEVRDEAEETLYALVQGRSTPALAASVAPLPTVQLQGWWKADTDTLLHSDGTLQLWKDQSGHRHHLQPLPNAAPYLEGAGTRVGVRLTASQGLAPLDLALPSPSVYTVALVVQPAWDTEPTTLLAFGADQVHAQAVRRTDGGLGLTTYANGDLTGIGVAGRLTSAPTIITVEVHAQHPAAFRLWLDGQPQPALALGGSATGRPLDAVLRIGGEVLAASAPSPWQGWVREVVLYDRPLTATEQGQLHAYLATRHQIPLRDGPPELLGNATFAEAPTYKPGSLFPQARWQVAAGEATITGGQDEDGQDYLYQQVALTPGGRYRVAVEVTAYTSGSLQLRTQSGAGTYDFGPLTLGVHTHTFTATTAQDLLAFSGRDNATFTLASLSVKRAE